MTESEKVEMFLEQAANNQFESTALLLSIISVYEEEDKSLITSDGAFYEIKELIEEYLENLETESM
jgi:hypothetical protein